MWELPRIDGTNADAARRLLDVRHSITVTNYYVTVYGYDADAEAQLTEPEGTRRWMLARELAELATDRADAQSAETTEDAAGIYWSGSIGNL